MPNRALVDIVLTHEDAKIPQYAKPGDAGCDVYAVPNPTPQEDRVIVAGVPLVDEKLKPVKYKDLKDGTYFIRPGGTVMVDLGLKIAVPKDWEMQVRSRSGMAKNGLVVSNSPGTIDSGYRGPCMVLLHNNTRQWRAIAPGTRVAQFVLKRAPRAKFFQVKNLNETERGEGGFGSSGTK
ncbi:MAG: dUTP diphosphatase [Gammaproteobacteria bacterium]|nr:dUTP diphosphatase [Gammaproteobacteria bacterium]